ncbi:MAG: alpha/beta hydrolase [Thermoleophilaceae bacterium]
MRRMILAATVAVIAALAPAATAAAQQPILFVHGWASSASTWNTMVDNFEADGWTASQLRTWSYDTSQSNVDTAAEVATEIADLMNDTGATEVDVIAHSMGSLSSRYHLKNVTGADDDVDEWVSLGGPNHGTSTANWCFQTSCVEMRVGSDFLDDLNAGDETPGAVNYGTWWSPCDSIINPDSSVALSGATNTETACISHSALTTDSTVYGQVRDFVD